MNTDDKPTITTDGGPPAEALGGWHRNTRIGVLIYVKFVASGWYLQLSLWPLELILTIHGTARVWAFGTQRSLTGKRRGVLRVRARVVDALIGAGAAFWYARQHSMGWVVVLAGTVLLDVWLWNRRPK